MLLRAPQDYAENILTKKKKGNEYDSGTIRFLYITMQGKTLCIFFASCHHTSESPRCDDLVKACVLLTCP